MKTFTFTLYIYVPEEPTMLRFFKDAVFERFSIFFSQTPVRFSKHCRPFVLLIIMRKTRYLHYVLIFFNLRNLYTRIREPTLQHIFHENFFCFFGFPHYQELTIQSIRMSVQRFTTRVKESSLSSAGQCGR